METHTVTLSLLDGVLPTFHPEEKPESRFSVCLCSVPKFPSNTESIAEDKAVIGKCRKKNGEWVWCDVGPYEKEYLGEALDENGRLDQWMFLTFAETTSSHPTTGGEK